MDTLIKLYYQTFGNPIINTPFHNINTIYADTTASGILFKPIETFLFNNIYPFYSNTHSNAFYGQLMCKYIDLSKKIIRKSINASNDDKIIFTGNGSSAAINQIIHCMNLKSNLHNKQNTVVFLTVLEHHSNYLPWKHLDITIVEIPILPNGLIDMEFFKSHLLLHKDKQFIISSINATSNVNGIHQDVYSIAQLVHQYNGIVMFDFSASAPYITINLHYNDNSLQFFDAIFLSTHKFFGGPGSPGILVANKKLFKNSIPYCPSGGTVRFVSDKIQEYSNNIETKETGGTPNIIGCIKAGMAFLLKDKYQSLIDQKEQFLIQYIDELFNDNDNVYILNPFTNKHRLPIYSFIIPNLHYNFVVKLLSDLFGIQTRGGVSCCSVLAQRLLHLSEKDKDNIFNQIIMNKGVDKKYGWVRVSFHYTFPKFIVLYIVMAIKFIAKYGHRFIPLYYYDTKLNNWIHKNHTQNDIYFSILQNDITHHSFLNKKDIQTIFNNNFKLLNKLSL